MLESAIQSGLCAAGMSVGLLGPMPTPAVAYLTHTLRAAMGIVISASHNLYHDNGLKFFNSNGTKLSSQQQDAITAAYENPIQVVATKKIGRVSRVHGAPARYIELCKSKFPYHLSLQHLKIVVDCANGATYHIAPAVFKELGAEVIVLNTQPNGLNINLGCGATDPGSLQEAVLKHQADCGLAFDGDGDRLVLVDHIGQVRDGDDILYILAHAYEHKHTGVIGTIYSNAGLAQSLGEKGIAFHRTPVGDRYIMQALQDRSWQLGGEPSGHIVHLGKTLSGDGIITALMVLTVMLKKNQPLAELIDYHKYPSKLINIPLPPEHGDLDAAYNLVKEAQAMLGSRGRLLLRPSGTEPCLRLLIESADASEIKNLGETLHREINAALHAS
jgi:phosphoglucosamine mutase